MLRLPSGHFLRITFVALLCAGLLAACGDEGPTGPATGTLDVTAATTGDDTDSDGFTLALGDGSEETVEADGSVTFADIDPGTYTLEASGVAANCAVEGGNPRTVEIVAGDTTEVALDVRCEALEGALEVATETTGEDVDADGYALLVDGTEADSIGVLDTVTVSGLEPGDREVELGGVAANCTFEGENPRTAAVAYDGTTTVAFTGSCEAREGSLQVMTETTGNDRDADGYTLLLDGADVGALSATDTLTLNTVAEGTYEVELSGVAANCAISSENPRTAAVVYDSTTEVAVSAACEYNRLVFQSSRSGDNIHIVNSDGSGLRTLTTADTAFDQRPAWSPDGSRVLFDSDRDGDVDIYVINEDGTGVENLTDDAEINESPDWSPDGGQFVFHSYRTGTGEIYIGDVGGSTATQVTSDTTHNEDPQWSPDGSTIVFTSDDGSGNQDVYTIGTDGSNRTRITDDPADDWDPSWSPDGSRIVFASDRDGGDDDIYAVDADGSNVDRITTSSAEDIGASWRHDGRIAFASDRGTGQSLYIMDSDGSNVEVIEEHLSLNAALDWTP